MAEDVGYDAFDGDTLLPKDPFDYGGKKTKTLEEVSGQPTGSTTGIKSVKPLQDVTPVPSQGGIIGGFSQIPGIWDRLRNDPQGIWDSIRRGADKAIAATPGDTGGAAAPLGIQDPASPVGGEAAPLGITDLPGKPKPIEKVADVNDRTPSGSAPKGSLMEKLDPVTGQPRDLDSGPTPPSAIAPGAEDLSAKSAELPPKAEPTAQQGPQRPGLFGMPGLLGEFGANVHNWTDQRRMQLLALAGGLAGAPSLGQGFGRGFTAAANTMPEQQKLNTQNATVNYLMKSGGLDRNQAMAVMGNPQLAHEIMGQMSGILPPKTMSIEPGKPQFQWIPGKGWQPVAGAAGNGGGATPEQWDAMSTNDRLKSVAQQYGQDWADGVKAIGEGRAIPPNRLAQYFTTAAHVYPGLDLNAYNARRAAYKNFYGGGKIDSTLKTFDQAIAQHAAGLPENVEKNNNWAGGRVVNTPLNTIGDAIGTNTTFNPLQTNATALTDELASLWKATGATDAEIQRWTPVFPVHGTIPQQKAAVAEIVRLAEGAHNALETQKQRDFGPAAESLPALMSPQTRETLDKLKAWAADPKAKWSGGGTPSSPKAINQNDVVLQNGHHYQHMPDGSYKQLD